MKRYAKLLILVLAVLLAGCAGEQDQLSVNGELCWPGLRFGMTAQEALDALQLQEGDYTVLTDRDDSQDENVYAAIYKNWEISIPGQSLFAPVSELRLEFTAHTREAEPMLYSILAVYPEGTDVEALRSAVEARLGPGEERFDSEACWFGENRAFEYMSDAYYLSETSFRSGSLTGQMLADQAATGLFLITEPPMLKDFYEAEGAAAALSFTTCLTEIYQEDPGCTRSLNKERRAFYGDGIIVYPGTMWGMSAEEVRTALYLKEIDHTALVDDGMVKQLCADCGFAGFDAQVTFLFGSWFEGAEPGLSGVEVRFTGNTDGLEELLTDTLGQPGEGGWKSQKLMSEILYPKKLDWYRQESNRDPQTEPVSQMARTEQGLLLRSNMAYACQMNRAEQPDPLAQWKALFDWQQGDEWYCCALTSYYESPEQIDLGELFSDCLSEERPQGAELQLLREQYDQRMVDSCSFFRVTPEAMEKVLQRYFGVSLDRCDLATMDNWHYCQETGAYLRLDMIPNRFTPQIEEVQTLENGQVAIFYRRSERGSLCTVTLQQLDGRWQVASNLEASE